MTEETLRNTLERVYNELAYRDEELGGKGDRTVGDQNFPTRKIMSKAAQRSERELNVFREFARRRSLPIIFDSIEERKPPKPDILCSIEGEGPVAFELKELCDQDLANAIAKQIKERNNEPNYLRMKNSNRNIIVKARNKKYTSDYPIELVFYTAGRTGEIPEIHIPEIREGFSAFHHQFRRIWYMGAKSCKSIISKVESEP